MGGVQVSIIELDKPKDAEEWAAEDPCLAIAMGGWGGGRVGDVPFVEVTVVALVKIAGPCL